MADISLESILRYCAAAEPQPWYPSQHAREQGIDRDQLDPFLEKLRLAGLVRLTDWIQGLGQGYVLTPEGKRLLDNPRMLDRLREGTLPTRHEQAGETAAVRQGNTTAWDRGEAVREALLNTDTPATITQLLAVANILVFLTGLYLGRDLGLPAGEYLTGEPSVDYQTVLHQLGALSSAGLRAGQWWRLITCAFVHIGFLHLGMNMFVLLSIGPLVERMWGAARFLALYLMSALGAGCLAMMLTPRGLVGGASGALCGLLASMGVWLLLNRDHMPGPLVAAWLRTLLVNLVIVSLLSMLPRVSWSGHLGGALAGAAASFLFTFERFGSGWRRLAAMLALLFLPVLWVLALLGTMLISGHWRAIFLQHEAHRQHPARLAQGSSSGYPRKATNARSACRRRSLASGGRLSM